MVLGWSGGGLALAEDSAASVRTFQKSVANGSFARWPAEKRHAAEQAAVDRIVADPESKATKDLVSILKPGEHSQELVPSREHPLILTDPKQRLRYLVNHALETAKAAADPKFVAPASKYFPGAIDSALPREKALKVAITPRTGQQGLWGEDEDFFRPHSTGCYAAPGEVISITIPQAWVGHAQAMIGIHRDAPAMSGYFDESGLHRDGFDLTKECDLDEAVTEMSSPYGGPVFLCLPNKNRAAAPFEITLGGVLRAPRFKSGVTSPEDWRQTLRKLPVPWAELESDSILISLPSARIRELDDPQVVLGFWDEVLAADAELACIPARRKVIELVMVDADIAAGYMYTSTDRVVVPDDDSCALMLDVAKLRKVGSWGHFHEIGHRHQFDAIDFAGTEEVTVNLFTLYVYQKVLHLDRHARHASAEEEAADAKMVTDYLAKPSFKKWQDEPFIGLAFFYPIIDEFGWDPILRLYQDYRKVPRDQYPSSEAAKRDFFYQHLSRAMGRDLADYFKRWAIPVRSAAYLTSDNALPPWLPKGWKPAATAKSRKTK